MKKVKKRVALIVIALILAVGAVVFRHQIPDTQHLLDLVNLLRDQWFTVPAYLLFVGATCFFAPAVSVIGMAGILWGVWPGALMALIGTNLWAHLQFAIGRYFSDGAIVRFMERQPKLKVIREELDQGGVLATVLIRQFPLPFIGVNVSAGMSPIPFKKWVIGNMIGLVPNCIIYTLLADAFLSPIEGLRTQAVLKALAAGVAVISLTLLTRVFVARRKQRT